MINRKLPNRVREARRDFPAVEAEYGSQLASSGMTCWNMMSFEHTRD